MQPIHLIKTIIRLSARFTLDCTGCPNKHGNSAVICKSFVCYVHILFVYVLTAYGCTW